MNFGPFLSESIEFTKKTLLKTWSRWVIFILLSLPLIVLSYVVSSGKIVDGITIHWDLVPWAEVIPLIAIGIIFSIFLAGYIVRLLRGGDTPPEFNNWASLALDGIRLQIIIALWAIPILILAAIQFSFLIGGSRGFSLGLLLLLPVLMVLELIVLLIMVLYGIIGVIRFARTGRVREAFAISDIGITIGRIGRANYFIALVVLAVIGLIYSVVTHLFSLIPAVGFLVPFLLEPFITVFRARFISHVYDEAGTDVEPEPLSFLTEEETTPPLTAVSGTDILKWGLALIVVIAACCIPVYLMVGTASQFLPSVTAEELTQAPTTSQGVDTSFPVKSTGDIPIAGNLRKIIPLVKAGTPFDSSAYPQNTPQSSPMVFQCYWDGTGSVYLSGDKSSLTGVYADDGYVIKIQPSGAIFDAPEHYGHQHPVVDLTQGMTTGVNNFTLIIQNWQGLSMSYGSIKGIDIDQNPYIIQAQG